MKKSNDEYGYPALPVRDILLLYALTASISGNSMADFTQPVIPPALFWKYLFD